MSEIVDGKFSTKYEFVQKPSVNKFVCDPSLKHHFVHKTEKTQKQQSINEKQEVNDHGQFEAAVCDEVSEHTQTLMNQNTQFKTMMEYITANADAPLKKRHKKFLKKNKMLELFDVLPNGKAKLAENEPVVTVTKVLSAALQNHLKSKFEKHYLLQLIYSLDAKLN